MIVLLFSLCAVGVDVDGNLFSIPGTGIRVVFDGWGSRCLEWWADFQESVLSATVVALLMSCYFL